VTRTGATAAAAAATRLDAPAAAGLERRDGYAAAWEDRGEVPYAGV